MGNMVINKRMHEVKININYNEYVVLRGFGTIREYRDAQLELGENSEESIELVMYRDFKEVNPRSTMIINSNMQEIKLYMYFHEYILFRGFSDIDNFMEFAIVDTSTSIEEMIYESFKSAMV